jgi:hypothetical protein
MRIRSKLAAIAAVTVGIAGSVFVASPAMAAFSDCVSYLDTICLTQNSDWTGRVWRQLPEQIVGCRKFSADGFDNMASTVMNSTKSSVAVWLYDANNCTGASVYVNSGQYGTLSPWGFDNKPSSIKVILL